MNASSVTKVAQTRIVQREPLEITDAMRETVKELAAEGLPHRQIRTHIINPVTNKPITQDCLRKYFSDELDAGRGKLSHQIMQVIVAQALAGDEKAQAKVFETYIAPLIKQELADEQAMRVLNTDIEPNALLRELVEKYARQKEQAIANAA